VNNTRITDLTKAIAAGDVVEVKWRPDEGKKPRAKKDKTKDKTGAAADSLPAVVPELGRVDPTADDEAEGAAAAALAAAAAGPPAGTPYRFSLEEDPAVEGALLTYEHGSGYVKVMAGGHDYDMSEYNRAFQSCRQPGSVFKPFVYSKALDMGYTLATSLPDVPISEFDWKRGKKWKPANYGGGYKGEVLLRNALVNSMNLPSLHLIGMVGPDAAAEWAKSLGITTDLTYPVTDKDGAVTYHSDPTLVLGAYCVKLWDVIQAYGVFARGGTRPHPIIIRKIVNRDGRVLEDNTVAYDPFIPADERLDRMHAALFVAPERVIDEKTAWLTEYLLRNVVLGGTGAPARKLGVPAAGKTGTTNDAFDAWFIGFTEDLLTGVWVGFDNNERPLGVGETGGKAALPIWLRFMEKAVAGLPQGEIPGERPKGIVGAVVDPKTGLLSPTGHGVAFPFVHGTVPTDTARSADKPDADMADRPEGGF
jgi:penicillin-binding protein 1A